MKRRFAISQNKLLAFTALAMLSLGTGACGAKQEPQAEGGANVANISAARSAQFQIAQCSQELTLAGGARVKREINITAEAIIANAKKSASKIRGAYKETQIGSNSTSAKNIFVSFESDEANQNGILVVSANAGYVDLSLQGDATVKSGSSSKTYFLNLLILDSAKREAIFQLKDEFANSLNFSLSCEKFSNLSLFSEAKNETTILPSDVAVIEDQFASVLNSPELAAFCVTKTAPGVFFSALRINRTGNVNGSLGSLTGPSFHHEPHVTGNITMVLESPETDEGIVVHELTDGVLTQVSGEDSAKVVRVAKVNYESVLDDAAAREFRDHVTLSTSEGKFLYSNCRLGNARFTK